MPVTLWGGLQPRTPRRAVPAGPGSPAPFGPVPGPARAAPWAATERSGTGTERIRSGREPYGDRSVPDTTASGAITTLTPRARGATECGTGARRGQTGSAVTALAASRTAPATAPATLSLKTLGMM